MILLAVTCISILSGLRGKSQSSLCLWDGTLYWSRNPAIFSTLIMNPARHNGTRLCPCTGRSARPLMAVSVTCENLPIHPRLCKASPHSLSCSVPAAIPSEATATGDLCTQRRASVTLPRATVDICTRIVLPITSMHSHLASV